MSLLSYKARVVVTRGLKNFWQTVYPTLPNRKINEPTLHHILALRSGTSRGEVAAAPQQAGVAPGCPVVVRAAADLRRFHHLLVFAPSILEPYLHLQRRDRDQLTRELYHLKKCTSFISNAVRVARRFWSGPAFGELECKTRKYWCTVTRFVYE